MKSVTTKGRTLGWRFICSKKHYRESTINTILARLARMKSLGTEKIIMLSYQSLMNEPMFKTVYVVEVYLETVTVWYQYFRGVAITIINQDNQKIGGPDDVEIDAIKVNKINPRRKENKIRKRTILKNT